MICRHCRNRVFKRLPMVSILSQIKPVHATPTYSLTYTSILFSHQRVVRFSGGVFFFWISHQTSICVCLLPHVCSMPYQSRPPWLDQSTYIWRRLQVMKTHIMLFSPTSCYFMPSLRQYNLKYLFVRSQREMTWRKSCIFMIFVLLTCPISGSSI
jgi:hypothetical protein